jgi:hypothetical protein
MVGGVSGGQKVKHVKEVNVRRQRGGGHSPAKHNFTIF